MRPDTILVPTGCDLKRLPLDASEVFLLSRLDGQSTLEEIGEIAGLDFDKARRLAERLVILGAVKPLKSGSIRPAPSTADVARRRIDPRAEAVEVTPPRPPSARPPKKRSTRSMKAVEVCELDEATQQKIEAMARKVRSGTFYEMLDVARDADRKDIKRAYFALAGVFHPDRFFGKKLGPLRSVVEDVFVRLTEASDTLGSRQQREAYDATLPPMPEKATAPPLVEDAKAEPRAEKKPSKLVPRVSPTPRKLSKRLRRSQLMAAAVAPPSSPPSSGACDREKFQRLQAAAKMLASQTRAEALVKAAEEAVRSGDIMGAANNYRLALQMHDDPVIKEKLAAIDRHSRDLRHEKYVVKGRAAERAERWDEAADHFVRANEARREGSVAERAAFALRLSNGDLRQATSLAEQAVAENGKNAEYRVTLGEVLLAAKLLVRAKEECEEALKLAPNHPRAKNLSAALKKA